MISMEADNMEFIIGVLIVGVVALCVYTLKSKDSSNSGAKEFICTSCQHRWSMKWNNAGMVPPCPICSMPGCDPNDYEDLACDHCGHKWRRYGTKGYLPFGAPVCPQCKKVIGNYKK